MSHHFYNLIPCQNFKCPVCGYTAVTNVNITFERFRRLSNCLSTETQKPTYCPTSEFTTQTKGQCAQRGDVAATRDTVHTHTSRRCWRAPGRPIEPPSSRHAASRGPQNRGCAESAAPLLRRAPACERIGVQKMTTCRGGEMFF